MGAKVVLHRGRAEQAAVTMGAIVYFPAKSAALGSWLLFEGEENNA